MAPQIRLATSSDIPVLHQLAHDIWPEAYGPLLPTEQIAYMLAWMYDPAAIAAGMAQGNQWALIEDPQPCGFAAWSHDCADPTILCLDKLYLLAEFRGHGLVDLTINLVVSAARSRGCRCIRLRVNRGNARAIAAYLKRGFTIIADDCADIGKGFVMDDHVMERSLTEPISEHSLC